MTQTTLRTKLALTACALLFCAACGIETATGPNAPDATNTSDTSGTNGTADTSGTNTATDTFVNIGPHSAGDTACQSVDGKGPYSLDLEEWTSTDGTTFTNTRTFQVCADVPSIAQHEDGTLIATYQGFEDKNTDSKWDKVAVRISKNNGASWSAQEFITVSGLPAGTGRPFDPTITFDPIDKGWRMYFSLTTNTKNMLDNEVCTHSAYSDNGVDYIRDSGERFCDDDRPVIDPAVGYLNGTWYYAAPSGAPHDGAFFATSTDGLNFTEGNHILSDHNHNWTGNFTATDGKMRFYGAEGLHPKGNFMWWAETSDGGAGWSDFKRTNIPAGKDPGIIKLQDGTWIMYVPTKRNP
jgi:hypothetical protein